MVSAARNDKERAGRRIQLAVRVVSPADRTTVRPESARMAPSTADLGEPLPIGRRDSLTAPTDRSAVECERAGEVVAAAERQECLVGGSVYLAESVAAPADGCSFLRKPAGVVVSAAYRPQREEVDRHRLPYAVAAPADGGPAGRERTRMPVTGADDSLRLHDDGDIRLGCEYPRPFRCRGMRRLRRGGVGRCRRGGCRRLGHGRSSRRQRCRWRGSGSGSAGPFRGRARFQLHDRRLRLSTSGKRKQQSCDNEGA